MMTPPSVSVTCVEKISDREWVRSDRRAENPGIWKEEDKLSSSSGGTNKINGMKRKKVSKFSAPGSETPSIPWKNLEGMRGRGSRGCREIARGDGEGAEGKDAKWAEGG